MTPLLPPRKFNIKVWTYMALLVLGVSALSMPDAWAQADSTSAQPDSTSAQPATPPVSVRYSPPPPTLRFFIEDEMIDLGGSVAVTQLPLLQLKVVPDSIFAAEHPYDVKYAMHWRAFVKRGTNLGPPQDGHTNVLYGSITSTANKGDVIQVEVDRIIRTDSVGRTEKVVLDKNLKYVMIPVK